jgi:hypothetical protein
MAGNIGVIGRARTGKDTAGKWLVDNRGYERVAFADPLRECALALDPIVGTDDDDLAAPGERLSEAVGFWGWERAKDRIPEVRRTLQRIGQGVRAIDEDFWLRTALKKVTAANEGGSPVVITDVRYPNEAESLKRAGFHLLYVERPGVPHLDHESEGALTSDDADYTIVNYGIQRSDFYDALKVFMKRVDDIESRRQYGRSY